MTESKSGLPPFIKAMLAPAFYERPTKRVDLVQTHISFVLLTDDTVYKLKKAVRFSFLDFSTVTLRHHFCREEVRLNRRLAPDIYDGVVAVVPDGDSFALADESDPRAVEYAVVMRRLPADRILASLLMQDEVTEEMIDSISRRLVDFHQKADAGPEVRESGNPARILKSMDDDFTEMEPFRGRTITAADDEAIVRYCRTQLERFSGLLERRRALDKVREGHGDLHAEHICLTDPLVIFDCIEFNRDFRCRDVAAEIAFLAMDLEYRGHPQLSQLFLRCYAEESEDSDVLVLAPLFKAHRAYIRGKVDSLKSGEAEVGQQERQDAVASARRHFELAYRYTWSEVRCLVVVSGLSGSGKSTVARELHRRTGFAHFNSDVIRKQLAGVPLTSRERARDDAGLYSSEHSARTYNRMLSLAAEELKAGRSAIVDATFLRRADRDAARAVAGASKVPVVFVECWCEPVATMRRLKARATEGNDPSDADEDIYRQQRAAYEVFASEEQPERIGVDTSASLAGVVDSVERAIRDRVV